MSSNESQARFQRLKAAFEDLITELYALFYQYYGISISFCKEMINVFFLILYDHMHVCFLTITLGKFVK